MNRPPILAGAILVALGLVLLLDELTALDAGSILATWWPLAVIAAGVLRWVRPPRSVGGGALLIVVGLVLQLWRLEVVTDLSLLWPAVLLTLGIWLLTGRGVLRGTRGDGRSEVDGAGFDAVTVFGDRRTRVRPGPFTGGSVVTVFGDADVDLTASTLEGHAEIDGVTVFGDVELVVPPGWLVTSGGLTIFGDIDVAPPEVAAGPVGPGAGPSPELRLDLVSIFGDVTVRRGRPTLTPPRPASTHPVA